MDFSTALNNYASDKGWRFIYARRDYQNLTDATNFIADSLEGFGVGETMLFCDPIVREGNGNSITYSGSFMILTKSDLDDDYDSRKQKYIDPLIDVVFSKMRNSFICDFDIDKWKSIELINQFDWNADGLMITFNVKGYE